MINFTNETVSLEKIHIGERYRRDYGDLTKLQTSIRENGLINPITLTVNKETTIKEPYILVAGGRRISALAEMSIIDIPCRIYADELSDLELRVIELAENFDRKALDWQEQVNLQQEIYKLQVAIHGEKTSTSPNASGFSMTDTAKLLDRDKSSISKDIKLAETVRAFPEVAWDTCKNKAEAVKLGKKLEEKVIRRELAKRANLKLGSGNVRLSKMSDAYILGNFFDLVTKIPDASVHLIEMDPPYAIDLQNNKKDYNYEGYNEVDPQFYEKFMMQAFKECYRVMSANSWLICWTSFDWAEQLFQLATAEGFTGTRIPGIWVKPNGQTNNPNKRLASTFEMFYYFAKGSPNLATPGATNTFAYNPVSPVKKIHPTERPMELMTKVLSTFGIEGNRVLVPFAGSGVTLIAAAELSMIPIGYELNPVSREGYTIRIAELYGRI